MYLINSSNIKDKTKSINFAISYFNSSNTTLMRVYIYLLVNSKLYRVPHMKDNTLQVVLNELIECGFITIDNDTITILR